MTQEQPTPTETKTASKDSLIADLDRSLSPNTLKEMAFWLVRLQRAQTGLRYRFRTRNIATDSMAVMLLIAEMMGLVRLERNIYENPCERDPLDPEPVWCAVNFCLSERGRLYVERFRPVWDGLGVGQYHGTERVPMPWPGLPQPYQPGTIDPTF